MLKMNDLEEFYYHRPQEKTLLFLSWVRPSILKTLRTFERLRVLEKESSCAHIKPTLTRALHKLS
jgi:hypothetical protein